MAKQIITLLVFYQIYLKSYKKSFINKYQNFLTISSRNIKQVSEKDLTHKPAQSPYLKILENVLMIKVNTQLYSLIFRKLSTVSLATY